MNTNTNTNDAEYAAMVEAGDTLRPWNDEVIAAVLELFHKEDIQKGVLSASRERKRESYSTLSARVFERCRVYIEPEALKQKISKYRSEYRAFTLIRQTTGNTLARNAPRYLPILITYFSPVAALTDRLADTDAAATEEPTPSPPRTNQREQDDESKSTVPRRARSPEPSSEPVAKRSKSTGEGIIADRLADGMMAVAEAMQRPATSSIDIQRSLWELREQTTRFHESQMLLQNDMVSTLRAILSTLNKTTEEKDMNNN